MRRSALAIGLLVFLLTSASALAVRPGPAHGDSVGVLETPQRVSYGVDSAVRQAMTSCLRDELQRAGFRSQMMHRTIDDFREGDPSADYLVEVAYGTADGGTVAAIGTGGIVGNTGVGAEVAVVTASVDAEVRVYDGRTLRVVDAFRLHSTIVSPAVTGVSLGGYYGYFSIGIPYFRNEPFRRAARDVARQAASRISGNGESSDEQRSR